MLLSQSYQFCFRQYIVTKLSGIQGGSHIYAPGTHAVSISIRSPFLIQTPLFLLFP